MDRSPNTIVEQILSLLLAGEIRRLDTVKADLLTRNNALLPREDWQVGFLVKGVFFKPTSSGQNLSQSTRVLEQPLVDEGNVLYEENQELSQDRQALKQVLVQLIWDCECEQDLRDALPDCLRELMPTSVARLSRTRPEAYTIQDNPRAWKYFERLLPKLQYYCAIRLLC